MKKIQLLSLAAAAGLLAGCATSHEGENNGTSAMTINQLPPAAQTTVRNEIGDQQIFSIKEENKEGQTAYKVEVDHRSADMMRDSLVVAADGSILKESRHLASLHNKMSEPAGSQNNADQTTPTSSPSSTQAPTEANPSGVNPAQANPTTSSPTTTTPNQ
jgi:hypothetical protein